MSFTTDKDGNRHYRLKADTGYLKSKGGDAFSDSGSKNPEEIKNLSFNYLYTSQHPVKKIMLSIPGFKKFGAKLIQIKEHKTGEIIFTGYGFTIFGMTRCYLPKQVTLRIKPGDTYIFIIQRT